MSRIQIEKHSLSDKWSLFVHLPNDPKWDLESYMRIMTFEYVEDVLAFYDKINEAFLKNCMIFIMRSGIKPVWEDEKNKNGSCISFKIHNKYIFRVWKKVHYALSGETLTKDKEIMKKVNGITLSPKKSFCIIKIWMSDCSQENSNFLIDIPYLDKLSSFFKKHEPEF